MQGLGAAEHGREGLQGHARDVVVGLLGGERHARGLGVGAQHERARVLGTEALAHQLRPQPPRRPELGDLLEEVVVHVEKERQTRREGVDIEARARHTTSRSSRPSARVKASSWAAVAPASRMW